MPESLGVLLVALWIGAVALAVTLILLTLRGGRTMESPRDMRAPEFGICPGCEDLKSMPSKNLLCSECWRALPKMLQVRLVDGYIARERGEGPLALIDALTAARRFLADARNPKVAPMPHEAHHTEESR